MYHDKVGRIGTRRRPRSMQRCRSSGSWSGGEWRWVTGSGGEPVVLVESRDCVLFPGGEGAFERLADEALVGHAAFGGRVLDGGEQFLGQAHVKAGRFGSELEARRPQLGEVVAGQVCVVDKCGRGPVSPGPGQFLSGSGGFRGHA